MTERIIIGRPETDEYPSYAQGYLERVEGDDPLQVLAVQLLTFRTLIGGLDDGKGLHRYQPGKWSVKEVLGHIIDAERILGFRALAIARGDQASLPGFDEEQYVAAARFDRRRISSFGDELDHLRQSGLALFLSFDRETWLRRGTANGQTFSVRALAWSVAGHAEHHRHTLQQRYGIGAEATE